MVYDGVKFTVGDPIIMTKNDYELGYMNGDEGKIVDIIEEDDGSHTMHVAMDDGSSYELSGKHLAGVELAYAITIHKSQGAECDTAVLLLPKEPAVMLERSLIYVGATRAKRKNIVIVEEDALDIGITNSKKKERYSGLNRQVREIAK